MPTVYISLHAIRHTRLWHSLSTHFDLLLRALTVAYDCHLTARLSSSVILLCVVLGCKFWIQDRSCWPLSFLSGLTQFFVFETRHPATMGPHCFANVDRDLNGFCFSNNLDFMGVGYHPSALHNLEDQGVPFHLVSTLQPTWYGWPYQDYRTPADSSRGHWDKQTIPQGWGGDPLGVGTLTLHVSTLKKQR